ncbi:MAG: MBL fold metallo-hydrolase [Syntrophobacteraceae bacterium]|nr:MBL fold metallo-hydrolase [Syntrophobacteraceae bacterium]
MADHNHKGTRKRDRSKPPATAVDLEDAANTLFNKGVALGNNDRHEDAIAVYDELSERFSQNPSPQIRVTVIRAMINKGVELGCLAKPDEEISTYDDLIERFSQDPTPEICEQVAIALLRKGITLGELDKPNEEISTYDDLIERFSQYPNTEIREQVTMALLFAMALLNKGVALGRLGKPDEEVSTYVNLIERFSQDPTPEIRAQVAKALLYKGITLGVLDKPDEEISTYDDLIERFHHDATPKIREQVANALLNKGIALGPLGRSDEEISAYTYLIERFGVDQTPEIHEKVGRALLCKGITLSQTAQRDAALAAFNDVISKFDTGGINAKFDELCAHALVSKAKLLKEIDEHANTEEFLSRAVRIAGESPQILSSYRLLSSHGRLVQRLEKILAGFDSKNRDRFRTRMREQEQRTNTFLEPSTSFDPERSLLFVLREWNSFTPIIPDTHELDRGGGYFIWHRGMGIVIDPGYDFIENFSRAGGRIHDIDCVVITHAHDDHTADFESILTLAHQYNARTGKGRTKKKIDLFLSTGANRKLSGFFQLRGDERIGRLVVLNPCDRKHPQRVQLSEHSSLTVLPAYHDDVVTFDGSVGLGFELELQDGAFRRLVFTGDSGLYPKSVDEKGDLKKYADGTTALDIIDESKSLYSAYQDVFASIGSWETIDLLVPHLGSIKNYELDVPSYDPEKPLLYANHLGLHGLSILLDELQFKTCIVSEFGEELKDVRLKLVNMLEEAVSTDNQGNQRDIFLVPGDLTILYDIVNGGFLCHETCEFEPGSRLKAIEDSEPDSSGSKECFRVFLFTTETASEGGCSARERFDYIQGYFDRLARRDLPYFKK